MKTLSSYHPVSLFIYFTSVIFISMFVNNPVIVLISLTGALGFYIIQGKGSNREITFFVILFALVALANPLFTHNGMTILFFLNNKPITLEAIFYGIFSGAMMVAVLFWFKSLTIIMTSDKLLYLFGRVLPKLSVILSMILRFVPLLKVQANKINNAQLAMGIYSEDKSTSKLKGSVRVFSIIITWSFERAMETSDSMKARGYGIKGRTNFSIFRFKTRDITITLLSIFLAFASLMGIARNNFEYYPELSVISMSPIALTGYISFAVLSFIPLIIEIKENIKWKFLKLKI